MPFRQSPLPSTRTIAGIHVELFDQGRGPTLLFLHPGDGFDPNGEFIRLLTSSFRVVALSHPGFGASDQPETFTTVEDLAHFYLDVLEELHLNDVTVVGASFGGWIAAALAVKGSERIVRVVLIDPIGAKFSGPETREIAELFMVGPDALRSLLYSRPPTTSADPPSEDALTRTARNNEAFCRYAWMPFDPKLAGRLHRLKAPTLVLWGDGDRVVSLDYGRKFAAALPTAEFQEVPDSGHLPHVEQPGRVVQAIEKMMADGAAVLEGVS